MKMPRLDDAGAFFKGGLKKSLGLSHYYFYFVFFLSLVVRDHVSGYFLAVYDHLPDTLFHMIGVLHTDVINTFPICAGQLEIAEIVGDAGIDAQAVEGGIYAQDVLGDIREGPGRGAGQPAVLAFAEVGGVGTCDHLGIDVRLGPVDLTELFHTGRAGLPVNFKGSVAASHDGFRDGDPGIVVAEDTCIFFVSRRIGGNFTQFHVISGISGLQESDAVFGIQEELRRSLCRRLPERRSPGAR